MSIEAMRQALVALEHAVPRSMKQAKEQINAIQALRTAIQQAEAHQPATPEPVAEPFVATYSSESIGGKQHDTGRVNKGPRGSFFASTASVEDASLIADALNAYTHPAPGVQDGYALVPVEPTAEMKAAGIKVEVYSEASDSIGALTWAEVAEIYRAMLAASHAQKGGK